MIDRPLHLRRITDLLRQFPVVAILGARQIGKTTLARRLVAGIAVGDLRLARLFVVHAGTRSFPLAPGIEALAFSRVLEDLRPLRRV